LMRGDDESSLLARRLSEVSTNLSIYQWVNENIIGHKSGEFWKLASQWMVGWFHFLGGK